MMAHRTATLQVIPHSWAEALQFTLAMTPSGQGEQTAQREIAVALENALDARRQRIIISQSGQMVLSKRASSLRAACHCDGA